MADRIDEVLNAISKLPQPKDINDLSEKVVCIDKKVVVLQVEMKGAREDYVTCRSRREEVENGFQKALTKAGVNIAVAGINTKWTQRIWGKVVWIASMIFIGVMVWVLKGAVS